MVNEVVGGFEVETSGAKISFGARLRATTETAALLIRMVLFGYTDDLRGEACEVLEDEADEI